MICMQCNWDYYFRGSRERCVLDPTYVEIRWTRCSATKVLSLSGDKEKNITAEGKSDYT